MATNHRGFAGEKVRSSLNSLEATRRSQELVVAYLKRSQDPVVAYLKMVNVPEWIAAITPNERTIGREDEVEILVPKCFRTVSRRHATVWADERHLLWICDLASFLGTLVNGVALIPMQPTQLMCGDRILLGRLELELLDNSRMQDGGPSLPVGEETQGECGDSRSAVHRLQLQRQQLLTPCEQEIVLWMSRGCTGLKAIGRQLHRSPHTVRTQLCSIFRKLNVHSREELLNSLRRT